MPLADRPVASANCLADRNWPRRSASATTAASIRGGGLRQRGPRPRCSGHVRVVPLWRADPRTAERVAVVVKPPPQTLHSLASLTSSISRPLRVTCGRKPATSYSRPWRVKVVPISMLMFVLCRVMLFCLGCRARRGFPFNVQAGGGLKPWPVRETRNALLSARFGCFGGGLLSCFGLVSPCFACFALWLNHRFQERNIRNSDPARNCFACFAQGRKTCFGGAPETSFSVSLFEPHQLAVHHDRAGGHKVPRVP
jgi:hypothetical protein